MNEADTPTTHATMVAIKKNLPFIALNAICVDVIVEIIGCSRPVPTPGTDIRDLHTISATCNRQEDGSVSFELYVPVALQYDVTAKTRSTIVYAAQTIV